MSLSQMRSGCDGGEEVDLPQLVGKKQENDVQVEVSHASHGKKGNLFTFKTLRTDSVEALPEKILSEICRKSKSASLQRLWAEGKIEMTLFYKNNETMRSELHVDDYCEDDGPLKVDVKMVLKGGGHQDIPTINSDESDDFYNLAAVLEHFAEWRPWIHDEEYQKLLQLTHSKDPQQVVRHIKALVVELVKKGEDREAAFARVLEELLPMKKFEEMAGSFQFAREHQGECALQ